MDKSDRVVVLFSRWFPYNKVKEQSFLVEELNFLKQHFKSVYVVPQKIEGEKYDLDENQFSVDETYARSLENIGLIDKVRTLASLSFLLEVFKVKFNKKKIQYAVAARLAGLVTQRWIKNFSKDKSDLVFYSFWMDYSTLGMVLAKNKVAGIKAVSRCHNFDLYGNEDNGFYVPFQGKMMGTLDAIYPDSFGGEEYIKKRFEGARCKAAIMGVPKANKKNDGSNDGVLRLFSCAYMIPRKRVDMLLKGLILLEKQRPDIDFEWQHVGAGPDWDKIVELKGQMKNPEKVSLLGNLSSEQLAAHYDNHAIDLFVNTSTKEGTPVSIMEAISRGIPVLVTEFGGNKEIADLGAGLTLSADVTPEEISNTLIELVDKGNLKDLKKRSYEVWEGHYYSEKNYLDFCNRLSEL